MFRYGIVGFFATSIDFLLTALGREWLFCKDLIANSMGFAGGSTSNYFLNKRYTFSDRGRATLQQYGASLGILAMGYGLNTAMLYTTVSLLSIHFYLGKIIATGSVVLWNFFGNRYITFGKLATSTNPT